MIITEAIVVRKEMRESEFVMHQLSKISDILASIQALDTFPIECKDLCANITDDLTELMDKPIALKGVGLLSTIRKNGVICNITI